MEQPKPQKDAARAPLEQFARTVLAHRPQAAQGSTSQVSGCCPLARSSLATFTAMLSRNSSLSATAAIEHCRRRSETEEPTVQGCAAFFAARQHRVPWTAGGHRLSMESCQRKNATQEITVNKVEADPTPWVAKIQTAGESSGSA